MSKIRVGSPRTQYRPGITFRREMRAKLELGQIPWFMKDAPKIRNTRTFPKRPFSRMVTEHEKLLNDLIINREGGE
jgi:hypothetical protein